MRDPARHSAWLSDLGYALTYREDGFIEVLVSREDERWLGRGADRDAAVRDAVRQMFPSHAAQQLLMRVQVDEAPAADEPSVAQHEDQPSATESPDLATIDDAIPGEEVAVAIDAVIRNEAAATTATPLEPVPEDAADAGPPTAATPASLASASAERRIILPERAPDDAVAEVEGILREVVDAEPEIAVMSPRLVQLNMLVWLCRARAQQQAFPTDGRVRRLVSSIAGGLGQLANAYWPGNIPALKATSSPADTMGVLGCTSPPSTWAEVSSRAERLIAQVRDDPDQDEDGWRDQGCLRPRPSDPPRVLSSVREGVEAILGPLEQRHDRALEEQLQRVDERGIEQLVGLGYQARWLRLGVLDAIAWGRVIGRLRWAAYKLGPRGTALARALDPDTRSASRRGWAEQLAAGPRERDRERRRSEAMRRRPWQAGTCSQEALVGWLVEAFDGFATDELVALAADVRDQVLALEDDVIAALPDRRHRSRLTKLRKSIAAGSAGRVVPVAEVDGDADVLTSSDQPDPGERLVAQVRDRVAGKAALFVSNRDDPNLQRAVEEAFQISLDWCDGSPRRLQSAVRRIQQGTYELVIAATGFMNHSTDRALGPACKQAGVPYAHAYRGRTLACARAIATAVGLDEQRAS